MSSQATTTISSTTATLTFNEVFALVTTLSLTLSHIMRYFLVILAKSVYRVYLDSACFSTYSGTKASFIQLFPYIPDIT